MTLSHDIVTCCLGHQPKVWWTTGAGRLLLTVTNQALVSKCKMQSRSTHSLMLSWLLDVAITHRCNASVASTQK